jgi:hypothetical protein
MITETTHFISRNHAITFYKTLNIKKDKVKLMIESKIINIGAPNITKHEILTVDINGRYQIVTTTGE